MIAVCLAQSVMLLLLMFGGSDRGCLNVQAAGACLPLVLGCFGLLAIQPSPRSHQPFSLLAVDESDVRCTSLDYERRSRTRHGAWENSQGTLGGQLTL